MSISDLIRPNIKDLKPYTSARDEFQSENTEMIFLDANENPFPNGVNRYPDPYQLKLKLQLASLKSVAPDTILLGNGSDEVLDLIFRAFCEPGKDKIITLPPTYGMYKVLADTNHVDVIEVPLSKTFQPNVETILKRSENCVKLLFLCSPNNPTANSLNREDVTQLIEKFRGIVVIDEAYIDFANEKSWLSCLEKYPNLIVIQTLSKAYAMAGIRLGVCYASTEIISVLNKIKPPYNVNALTQERALEQLKNQKHFNNQRAAIIAQREWLILNLQDIAFVEWIYPSDANFLLIKVDDANFRYMQLLNLGVVVRNRTNQLGCTNCLRITVGTENENRILIQTLKQLQ